jgi:hypothetical protein
MRSPVLHFALLGALLFAVQAAWSPALPSGARPTIVVPAGADATATAAAIDEEVLFREALARQFDGSDKVVRARLVRVGRYLGLARDGSDDAVEREARALGLQRSDPVIRRHLVEMMRLVAAKPGRHDLPSESALSAYYREHADRFALPARLRLTHVYLSAERRGAALEGDAAELLAALRRGEVEPEAAAQLGDPFARGAELTLRVPEQVEAVFGPASPPSRSCPNGRSAPAAFALRPAPGLDRRAHRTRAAAVRRGGSRPARAADERSEGACAPRCSPARRLRRTHRRPT